MERERKRDEKRPAEPVEPTTSGDQPEQEPEPRPPEDRKIDEAVEESFPASDPPAWTPSTL